MLLAAFPVQVEFPVHDFVHDFERRHACESQTMKKIPRPQSGHSVATRSATFAVLLIAGNRERLSFCLENGNFTSISAVQITGC